MPRAFWFLITTATACSLHDLERTCRPLDAPNEECCALYGSLDEGDWCAANVRNSSGYAALTSNETYAAYALARACGSPLPSCFVDVDREATAVKLTVLIDWREPYASDSARWDAEITAICSPAIEYWQPHIGAYLGRDEFVEYAYTLSPALFPYESMEACVRYLSRDVADRCLDGAGGFFAGDTRACRQMHLQLALLDPIVHCPHLGPESEKCAAPPRAGARVVAFCDDVSPPYGDEAAASRPPLGVVGGLLLLAPLAVALVLAAAGALGWRGVPPPRLAGPPRRRLARRGRLARAVAHVVGPVVGRRVGHVLRASRAPEPPAVDVHRGRARRRRLDAEPREQPVEPVPRGVEPDPRGVEPVPGASCRTLAPPPPPPEDAAARRARSAAGCVARGARGARRVLRGVHGAFDAASLTAIVGPSGSGKTTLLKICVGRERPPPVAAGELAASEVGGAAAVPRSRAWAAERTQLSSATCDLPLSGALTLGEQLRYYALTIPLQAPVATRLRRAAAVQREVRLEGHDGTRVDKLSEGQHRRLLLAIRLLALPSVLALDELTSGQDAATALALMRGAAALAARGLNVVVVIHQPSAEIFALFDKVLALRSGGDGCDVARPEDVADAAAALRGTAPDVALNPADVLLEARRELIDAGLALAPPPELGGSKNETDDPTVHRTTYFRGETRRRFVLALRRFSRESGAAKLGGYGATALSLAAVVASLFNPEGRGHRLTSTADGADVVFVLFIGLTTLCGVSNFQANAVLAPAERARFERDAAARYDTARNYFAFVVARDFVVVNVGAAPFFLAVFYGCGAAAPDRLLPMLVVFLLAQHAFHATGSLFFHVAAPPEDATPGIVLSGVYNFVVFLLAGVVKRVSDMHAAWALVARALPGYSAMGLLVFYAFEDRMTPAPPSSLRISIFAARSFEDRVALSIATLVLNFAVARGLLFVALVRAARRPPCAALDGADVEKVPGKARGSRRSSWPFSTATSVDGDLSPLRGAATLATVDDDDDAELPGSLSARLSAGGRSLRAPFGLDVAEQRTGTEDGRVKDLVRRYSSDADKPKLLVFGGVDGTDRVGIGNRRRLSEFYDVRSLVLDADDVADHGALVRLAVAEAGGDAVSVVGESMGAVIALRGALGFALARPQLVDALVVCNAATSYARAPVSLVAPLLPRIPQSLYSSLSGVVSPLFGRSGWTDGLAGSSDRGPGALLASGGALAAALPPATLAHRERDVVRRGAASVNALDRLKGAPP
ncbi:ATPase [Aureococcus anophagefferens]|nr:ATPase [Aureococcus anophagefferens]